MLEGGWQGGRQRGEMKEGSDNNDQGSLGTMKNSDHMHTCIQILNSSEYSVFQVGCPEEIKTLFVQVTTAE